MGETEAEKPEAENLVSNSLLIHAGLTGNLMGQLLLRRV
jgi:hypothetical protein